MQNKRPLEILCVVLIISNIVFAYGYFTLSLKLGPAQSYQEKVEVNKKVVSFTSLFIQKVLQAETEVDFETRLSLENAVRDLKDEEIMTEWQNFTGSKTEAEAQNSVKKLLEILISKIQR